MSHWITWSAAARASAANQPEKITLDETVGNVLSLAETFEARVGQDVLSFLGLKRGIEEGKVDGESISFYVRYEEVSGDDRRERKNYYWGKLSADRIIIRMQDDRGNPAVEWALTRADSAR